MYYLLKNINAQLTKKLDNNLMIHISHMFKWLKISKWVLDSIENKIVIQEM